METILAYTDGGSRGNPGPSGLGVFICDIDGVMQKEVHAFLGIGTNNVAEYQAVVMALTTLKKMYGKNTHTMQFEIRMDSQLVERQLNGNYRVKHPALIPLFMHIKHMEEHDFPHIEYVHVRREQNKDADRLANVAMDAMK